MVDHGVGLRWGYLCLGFCLDLLSHGAVLRKRLGELSGAAVVSCLFLADSNVALTGLGCPLGFHLV